jgi:hypothetical protein
MTYLALLNSIPLKKIRNIIQILSLTPSCRYPNRVPPDHSHISLFDRKVIFVVRVRTEYKAGSGIQKGAESTLVKYLHSAT